MRAFSTVLIMLCLVGGLAAQSVSEHGQLQVEGTQLKGESGEEVVLRGVSYGWHCFWPRFYNVESVKHLKEDWKIDVIRAAMGVEPQRGYLDQPDWSKEKVKAVVDAAIEEDIFVIIDWHSHDIFTEEAVSFFKEMAQTYGDKPHVIYEIFNEPDQESWAEIKAYSKTVIDTIRKYDPDNIILVGTPRWSQNVNEAADDPLTGYDNLMYTIHYYAATHGQELRAKGDYALEKDLPLFISESAGMEASGDGPMNYETWQKWREWGEENKLSWITWSVSDKDETCSMLYPSAAATGPWKEEDLKESGRKTREILRELAD